MPAGKSIVVKSKNTIISTTSSHGQIVGKVSDEKIQLQPKRMPINKAASTVGSVAITKPHTNQRPATRAASTVESPASTKPQPNQRPGNKAQVKKKRRWTVPAIVNLNK